MLLQKASNFTFTAHFENSCLRNKLLGKGVMEKLGHFSLGYF